jgi:predicted TIM-barrel fold metal-dependent hydrolase
VNLPVLTNPRQFESVNRFAAEINAIFSNKERKIISFAGIHPACEDIEEKMKWIKENRFLGVKLHPDYQETFINDPGYIRILECARELDLIVLTHAGVDIGYRGCPVRCPPSLAKEVIARVPYSKLVLAHYGAAEQHEEVFDTLCGLDVYFDTSYVLRFLDKTTFARILEKHGEDRILFGSDSPWSDIQNDVEILKSFSLNKQTEQKIFCENAKKLLGI